jgi:tetratricopeptide (TPR) repeat protein
VDADVATVPLEELDRLWDFDDPVSSERRFASLLPRALDEEGGARLAELLTQLARAQGLQRRFDDAGRTLREAEHALRTVDTRGRIRLLLERGRVANSSGAGDRGRASFLEAWELARAAGEDPLSVDAAHMLGIVEPGDAGWAWNERAMHLARSSADPRAGKWIASLANNMGWGRHDAGLYEEALALFRLALDERRRDGDPGRIRIAQWCVARCLRSLGRVDEALAEQRALAAELEAAGEVDGYVDEEIGECLLALGRGDDARPFFGRAYAGLSGDPGLPANEPERLERLRALAAGDPAVGPAQTEP